MRRSKYDDVECESPIVPTVPNNLTSKEGTMGKEQGVHGGGKKVPQHRQSGTLIDEALQKAMDAVTDHSMKVKTATRAFGIPGSSLRDHLYEKTTSGQRGNLLTLKSNEKKKLLDYIFKIQDLGHPLIPVELHLKVALATQTKEMPWSATGVFGKGWLKRFRLRHPEIATRKSQGLDIARTCALCPNVAKTLYTNLEELYTTFKYPTSHIWNCDKSGFQAGRSKGATVLAK